MPSISRRRLRSNKSVRGLWLKHRFILFSCGLLTSLVALRTFIHNHDDYPGLLLLEHEASIVLDSLMEGKTNDTAPKNVQKSYDNTPPKAPPGEILSASNPHENLQSIEDPVLKQDRSLTDFDAKKIENTEYQDFPITSETHAHEFREALSVDAEFNDTLAYLPWYVNSDEWWTHHPAWEEDREQFNDTHYCFRYIKNPGKRMMYERLYQIQFHGNCSNTFTKRMWNSGWGADFTNVVDGLMYALARRQPVQIVEKAWHYAHPGLVKPTDDNKHVPPACPRANMFCYFLPISNCPKKSEGDKGGYQGGAGGSYQYYYEYATRRQTWLRRDVYEFTKRQNISSPCTTIHVRRGDVVLHRSGFSRRYYPISDYMNTTSDIDQNIFLLTDDANAIIEAKTEFPSYNWMYIDRPRYKASHGGWERQLPSNNPSLEVTILLSISQLVRRCSTLINTRSAFANRLFAEMSVNEDSLYYGRGDSHMPRRFLVDKGRKKYHPDHKYTVNISFAYSSVNNISEINGKQELSLKDGAYQEAPSIQDKNSEFEAEVSPEDVGEQKDGATVNGLEDNTADVGRKEDNAGNGKIKMAAVNLGEQAWADGQLYRDFPVTSEIHVGEFREVLPADAQFVDTFCLSWDVNSDDWWTHHPTWEEGAENETHYCFQPIRDRLRANMYETLYQVQFQGNCSGILTKRMWNSGWGADMTNVIDALRHAYKRGRPVQIVEKPWHYADPATVKPTEENKNTPPACPRANMFCYFLPISNCPKAPVGAGGGVIEPKTNYDRWWYDYAIRRQTWLRREVYRFTTKQNITSPCTAIHVRRGDVVFHGASHRRRYYPISAYINATSDIDHNIFLLTDDANAIAEAKTEFPNFNWQYIDRPRYRANEGGWERHLPSNNPSHEVTVLLSTFQLVKKCTTLIHSRSTLSELLYSEMAMAHGNVRKFKIDKGIKKHHADNIHSVNISRAYDETNFTRSLAIRRGRNH